MDVAGYVRLRFEGDLPRVNLAIDEPIHHNLFSQDGADDPSVF